MPSVSLSGKTVLVTGCAGFIGSFLCERLLESGENIRVAGIDSLTDYYDVSLKDERLKSLSRFGENFSFTKGDIASESDVEEIFQKSRPAVVVNLAAQAGVRYSIENPGAYVRSNVVGFHNILEACRRHPVEHLVFASSSSVYGANKKVPFSTADKTDSPVSLYAATKKSNELFARACSSLYGVPSTGLRFFTVYGPMGRPDMAYFKFADRLASGRPIQIYNHGDMKRDFTYIDDITAGVESVMRKSPEAQDGEPPFKVYNIGNSHPESLLRFVEILEGCLMREKVIDKPGEKEFLPMQPGDVLQTFADVSDLERDFGFKPSTRLEDGLARFAKWYKTYRDRTKA